MAGTAGIPWLNLLLLELGLRGQGGQAGEDCNECKSPFSLLFLQSSDTDSAFSPLWPGSNSQPVKTFTSPARQGMKKLTNAPILDSVDREVL